MKTNLLKHTLFILILFVFAINSFATITIGVALCENKIHPTGVSTSGLRFNWEIRSNARGVTQKTYQLVIASTLKNLNKQKYDVYNSTKIKSGNNIAVQIELNKLKPATTYFWKVRVWDNYKKCSKWSKPQHFITGLPTEQDWKNAKWIGYNELPDSLRLVPGIHGLDNILVNNLGDKYKNGPVLPLFRKIFTIKKPIQNATLFVTGLGHYEASVNGERIGKAFLSPGWTQYDKRVLYNTYDITKNVNAGENAIGVILGNGFYNISRERYFKLLTAFGNPKMICRLKISYNDGTEENIISDSSWKSTPSPITYSNIYGGESYDARMEQKDWNNSQFNDKAWKEAQVVKVPLGKLTSESDYPVALVDTFTVKKVWEVGQGTYVYDFGQNASAIFRLKIKGKKGQTIKLTPAELINEKGLSNQSASGEPHFYTYTIKGDGVEVWQPKFTYYGFRYIQVEGAVPENYSNSTNDPVLIDLISLHNRNTNPSSGSFECSNDLLNKTYNLINWAIKSNMQSVLTDCPHREKLSWLEQDYLMGNSVHYNFDIYNLYSKLVSDMMDSQHADGLVPDITPEYVRFDGGFLSSPEWGSASVVLPWLLYKWYGDTENIKKAYPMMTKYVDYLAGQSNNHILSFGLGDWFDYGPNQPGFAQLTPPALTATAIYYYDVELMSKMAALLGKSDDVLKYENLSKEIRTSFNKEFFNSKTNTYSTGSQTAMAMPLCLGLVDESNKKQVLANLIDSINAKNKALTAGDIGFHFLVQALDEGGASQVLFDMINRDDVPGYGFQLKKGATALTESWPALENVSNNHFMLGHVMEWFYSGIAGISQEENSIGFKHIKIRPQPVGDINFAKGSFHSPYGWITTDWKRTPTNFSLKVHIPVNTTATVYLPVTQTSKVYLDGTLMKNVKTGENSGKINIGSGDYYFEVIQ